MNVVDKLLARLVALGIDDVVHVTGDLGKHLRGTFEHLQTWDCPEELCVAGLFHAVYGTYGFMGALVGLERRPEVAAIIGCEQRKLCTFTLLATVRIAIPVLLAMTTPDI